MNTKRVSIFSMVILTLFTACFASRVLATTADSVNVVSSATTVGLGQTVTVNVTITNVGAPGIYGYQLQLTYNNTLLNATSAAIPSDHMLKPATPSNIFTVDPGTINQSEGHVTFAVTMLGTEAGKTGSGTLVTVTFTGLLLGTSTVDLPQAELIVVDVDTAEISGYTINPTTLQVVPEFTIAVLMAALVVTSAVTVALRKKHK
jgi:hypothetical protein